MKRILSLAFVLLMLFTCLPMNTAYADSTVKISTPTTLYSQPGSGQNLGELTAGTSVTIISQYENYYQISLFNGSYNITGYIAKSSISNDVTSYAYISYSTPLYSSANTSSASQGTLQPGESIGIIRTSGNFYYVKAFDSSGKEYTGYVLIGATTTTFTGGSYYTSSQAPVYSYYGSGGTVITNIPANTTVNVTNAVNGYYYVHYNGHYGYVPSSYLVSTGNNTGTGTASGTYYTTMSVALYSTASSSSYAIAAIPAGAAVTALSTSNGYTYVTYNGQAGYVLSTYLTTVAPSGNTTTSYTNATTYLYASPSPSSSIYTTLPAGTSLKVLSTSGNYSNVTYNGYNGWVLSSALNTSSADKKYYASVSAPLYSQANTSSTITATIPAGTALSVQYTWGDFYYVGYNGVYGYVPTSLVMTSSSNTGTTNNVVSGQTYQTSANTNLYVTANTAGNVYATIPAGTSLNVISTSGNFAYVQYNTYYGYVLSSHLNTAGNGAAGYQTAAAAPLYVTASTSSHIYATIPAGTSLTALSATDNFIYVYYGSYYGYVSKSNLTGGTSTGSSTLTPSNSIAAQGTVITGAVMYKTDSTSGDRIGRISSSGSIGIISRTTTGFYYVVVGNYYGYIQTSEITVSTSALNSIPYSSPSGSSTTVTPEKKSYITNCNSWVSLRKSASSSSSRLAKVPKNASVTILGTSGKYTKVSYNGKTGYISSQYVA